jgi:predicted permease
MTSRPPVLPRLLATLLLRGDARQIIIGDLDEAFTRRLAGGAPRREARRAYWREAAASVVSVQRDRVRRTAAPSRFGSRAAVVDGLWLDVRYAARGLAASRGFTAVAVVSLAIGLGAATALANTARALLLSELPAGRPNELSWVYWAEPPHLRLIGLNDAGAENSESNYSYPLYEAIKAAAGARAAVAGFNLINQITVTDPGRPAILATGLIVSGDFFQVVQVPVAMGRPIAEDDDVEGAAPAVVITDAFWQRMFGGDSAAIGSILRLNGIAFNVVGVTAPGFRGLSVGGTTPPADVIVPFAAQPIVAPSWTAQSTPLDADLTRQWVRIVARIPNPNDRAAFAFAASAAIPRVLRAVASKDIDLGHVRVHLFPAARGLDAIQNATAAPLGILAIVVGIFLMLTCTNLAGMVLARGLARRRDLSVRRALGAGRWRLVRQSLVESLLLAAAGGAAAVVLAAWSAPALAAMVSNGLGTASVPLRTDWGLLGIAAGASLVTALTFGIAPALRLTRGDAEDLGSRSAGSSESRTRRGGQVLIVVQFAISVPLVIGALLFLRTLHNFAGVDLGFNPHALVLFEIHPPRDAAAGDAAPMSAAGARTLSEILARLNALPGVASTTIMEDALVSGWKSETLVTAGDRRFPLYMQAVGPRFFETMGIRLIAGRGIMGQDDAHAPAVAVINETAARRDFPGGSPVGRTFRVGTRTLEIVGVAADATYTSLRQAPPPTFYDSYLQRPGGTYDTWVAVRTTASPATLFEPIRQSVALAAPDLPVSNMRTQQAQIDASIGRERVLSGLLVLFGAFALLLASLGLHGLTSYAITRRTSEIGIRLALGARRTQVLWMLLRQVLALGAIGLGLGLPLAYVASPVVAAYLFGVAPRDLITIGMAAAVLIAVALVAGWLPARRAARLDPLAALRVD